eukprot:TRINITY_DN2152_c0_g2_i5.p1 TRINITY_DN2152_c0_g2~~TRINITY_DN2152_c0_g2_i5.p1  ORF type:complete len:868 (-),score=96.24 TRINITY_DN2152_c0_g2_i5:476-3079(-)
MPTQSLAQNSLQSPTQGCLHLTGFLDKQTYKLKRILTWGLSFGWLTVNSICFQSYFEYYIIKDSFKVLNYCNLIAQNIYGEKYLQGEKLATISLFIYSYIYLFNGDVKFYYTISIIIYILNLILTIIILLKKEIIQDFYISLVPNQHKQLYQLRALKYLFIYCPYKLIQNQEFENIAIPGLSRLIIQYVNNQISQKVAYIQIDFKNIIELNRLSKQIQLLDLSINLVNNLNKSWKRLEIETLIKFLLQFQEIQNTNYYPQQLGINQYFYSGIVIDLFIYRNNIFIIKFFDNNIKKQQYYNNIIDQICNYTYQKIKSKIGKIQQIHFLSILIETYLSSMLIRIAAVSAIGGFLFGYDLGLIGGALPLIEEAFQTSGWTPETIVAMAKFGAVFGTFIGGAMMLYYGRRKALAINGIFFLIGPIVMAAAPACKGCVALLIIGRFVLGLGIGSSSVVTPAYLGEMSPAAIRGGIVEVYEVMICIGLICASLMDWAFQDNWRGMVGIPVIPAACLVLSLCFLPESPRWLVMYGYFDEALAIIHKVLEGEQLPEGVQSSTPQVESELLELWSSVEKDQYAVAQRRQEFLAKWGYPSQLEQANQTTENGFELRDAVNEDNNGEENDGILKHEQPSSSPIQKPTKASTFFEEFWNMMLDIGIVLRGPEKRAVTILLWLAFFNQACASTAIINYGPTLLQEISGESLGDNTLRSSLIGVAKTFGVVLGMVLVDKYGRRVLLMWGSVGCAVCMGLMTWAKLAGSWVLALLCICGFILWFSLSWAGIFWVLASELFSMSAKSPASSAATATLFFTGAVTNLLFLWLQSVMKEYVFLLFGGMMVVAFLYVYKVLPETKGKTLAQVQMLINNPLSMKEVG